MPRSFIEDQCRRRRSRAVLSSSVEDVFLDQKLSSAFLSSRATPMRGCPRQVASSDTIYVPLGPARLPAGGTPVRRPEPPQIARVLQLRADLSPPRAGKKRRAGRAVAKSKPTASNSDLPASR